MPASTSEPVARSCARKRTRTAALGTTKSATRIVAFTQALVLTEMFSTSVQVAPPSAEISTGMMSAFGAPPRLFEYQYQYSIDGSTSALMSKEGETRVVNPPSTSAAPAPPPTAPLPVIQQSVPGTE